MKMIRYFGSVANMSGGWIMVLTLHEFVDLETDRLLVYNTLALALSCTRSEAMEISLHVAHHAQSPTAVLSLDILKDSSKRR